MERKFNSRKVCIFISLIFVIVAIAIFGIFIVRSKNIVKISNIEDNDKMALTSQDGIWEYSLDYDSVYVEKYKGTDTDVNIPSTIDGKVVIGIADRSNEENFFDDPSSITTVSIPSTVTYIGRFAFYNCTNLTNLEMPEGIKRISAHTFNNCTSLESLEIPEGVTTIDEYAFGNCTSLKNIQIPTSVKQINVQAFVNCESLTNIEIPEGVTNISHYLFAGCKKLTNIVIPEGVTSIGIHAFSECIELASIVIPEGVTTIENGAFYRCESLTDVVIPSTVTSIGKSAFTTCKSLTSIEIPEGVTVIEQNTFSDCRNLTSVVIPTSVTSIGKNAFFSCESLESVQIPGNVKTIGEDAFSRCNGLKNVEIMEGVTTIGNSAFVVFNDLSVTIPRSVTSIDNSFNAQQVAIYCYENSEASRFAQSENTTYVICEEISGNEIRVKTAEVNGNKNLVIPSNFYGKPVTEIGASAFNECSLLQSIEISEGVEIIRENAFAECTNLERIEIPESVTTIEGSIFYECKSLISVDIPNGVTRIPAYMFSGCSNLRSVNIPTGVTIIEISAFVNCESLTSIKLPEGLTTIGDTAFLNCKSLTNIEIPSSVTSIGRATFNGSGLENIEIPSGVTDIGINAFFSCSKLQNINVDTNNKNYSSEQGVLFDKNKTVLIACPAGSLNTEYIIPSSVTNIEDRAFWGCSNIKNIKIPETVTSIGILNFASCEDLTVTIPKSVTTIDDTAFENSTNTTIKCYRNSYAHEFAVNKAINFILIDTLKSISIKTLPTKTSYVQNKEELNFSGGVLTLTFEDDTSSELNIITDGELTEGITVSNFDNKILGDQEITITYQGYETKLKVNVIQDFTYEEKDGENGKEIIITGIGTIPEDNNIVIPEEINGNPVTEIGPGAFKDKDELISIEIPDTVIKIEDDAFEGCDDITIECNSNSTAEQFAKDKDMNYELLDKTIANISIKKVPNKILYTKEDTELDVTGGRILLTYTDGDSSPISMKKTGVQMTGFNNTVLGEQQIKVSYKEKETSFNIEVKDNLILLGDINRDGKVDATDLLLMKRHIIAQSKTDWILTGDSFEHGDMNSDKLINATDLLLLKRVIVKNNK